MFCPKCKAEYRDGFWKCADCDIHLVPELPSEPELEPAPPPEYIEYEEVLSTFNMGDIALLKSILDGAGITYFFQGEQFNIMRPWVQPARLMVDKNQVKKAMELIKDLRLSFRGLALDDN